MQPDREGGPMRGAEWRINKVIKKRKGSDVANKNAGFLRRYSHVSPP